MMKTKRITPVLFISILLIVFSSTHLPLVHATTTSITAINEDGYVWYRGNLAVWGRTNAQTLLAFGDGPPADNYVYRGYIEWDISAIPDAAIITKTALRYEGERNNGDAHIHECTGLRPSTGGNQALYIEVGEGTVYADPGGFPVVAQNQEVDLGDVANTDLMDQLGVDWFAIGIQADNENLNQFSTIYSIEQGGGTTPTPTLYIEYTLARASTELFGAGFNNSSPYVELNWVWNYTYLDFFEIQNSTDRESWDYLGQSTTTNYTDNQVVNGTKRYYRVRACNLTNGDWENSTFSDVNFERVYFITGVGPGPGPTIIVTEESYFWIPIAIVLSIITALLVWMKFANQ
jgi:hypothetical protein